MLLPYSKMWHRSASDLRASCCLRTACLVTATYVSQSQRQGVDHAGRNLAASLANGGLAVCETMFPGSGRGTIEDCRVLGPDTICSELNRCGVAKSIGDVPLSISSTAGCGGACRKTKELAYRESSQRERMS